MLQVEQVNIRSTGLPVYVYFVLLSVIIKNLLCMWA